jgi:hypothetical protein
LYPPARQARDEDLKENRFHIKHLSMRYVIPKTNNLMKLKHALALLLLGAGLYFLIENWLAWPLVSAVLALGGAAILTALIFARNRAPRP